MAESDRLRLWRDFREADGETKCLLALDLLGVELECLLRQIQRGMIPRTPSGVAGTANELRKLASLCDEVQARQRGRNG